MDKALVYGTRDSGFDPQWSRSRLPWVLSLLCFFIFGFFNLLSKSSLKYESTGKSNKVGIQSYEE